jgi:serine/threonine-protein kinase
VLAKGDSVSLWVSTGTPKGSVPTLEGLTQDAAQQAITQNGFKVGAVTTDHSIDVPAGSVVSASQKAGATVDQGTTIDLVLSDGEVDLPDLTGKPITDAESTLKDLGLTASIQPETSGCGAASDVVYYQTVQAGAVDQGSTVILQQCVGDGSDPSSTPTPTDTPPTTG